MDNHVIIKAKYNTNEKVNRVHQELQNTLKLLNELILKYNNYTVESVLLTRKIKYENDKENVAKFKCNNKNLKMNKTTSDEIVLKSYTWDYNGLNKLISEII